MKLVFSKKCLEYNQPGHPESPERVGNSYELLKGKFELVQPKKAEESDILLVHSDHLLETVKSGNLMTLTHLTYRAYMTLQNSQQVLQ